jgi:phosphohistidine swiveling domain-containing protein
VQATTTAPVPGRGPADDVTARPLMVGLSDPRATDPALVGAKAANLARCAAAGLPVLPGVVVTTAGTDRWGPGKAPPQMVLDLLRAAVDGGLPAGAGTLVVRSSSTVEDAERSSMAGRFRSVLDVSGWDGVVAAVRAVRDSAALDGEDAVSPLAVLIQPQLAAEYGGVLFGADPVEGDDGHLVVEVAAGNPSALVGGDVTARHLVLSRRGRRRSSVGDGPSPGRRECRALADLAVRVEVLFQGPQDVEWAFGEGRVWLLQCRPITVVAERAPAGPVLGPGPVADTFPEPLSRLECEAWLAPLREGMVHALRATGAVSAGRLAASPVALTVGAWPAVDLELLGVHRRPGRAFNPLIGMRRLLAAWRVGRLRAALPGLASDLAARVDADLAEIPPLAQLGDGELVSVLANTRAELAAVHAHEILAGMLVPDEAGCTPAPALALASLARARLAGRADVEAIAADPVLLTLSPPRFGGTGSLSASVPQGEAGTVPSEVRLGTRDLLRVRARWLQELSARAMGELGTRLAAAGRLAHPASVRELGLDELGGVVAGDPPPADLTRRAGAPGPPLPPRFRLTAGGGVVALRAKSERSEGLGAGGGRAVGCVRQRPPGAGGPRDTVLVVPTLDPGLAAVLPALAGLVSETGSALSHLAILARELGVATVVGVPDARRRFPVGGRVVVDGRSGEVRQLGDAAIAEEET